MKEQSKSFIGLSVWVKTASDQDLIDRIKSINEGNSLYKEKLTTIVKIEQNARKLKSS